MVFPALSNFVRNLVLITAERDGSVVGKVASSTDCESNWELINGWLNKCLGSHEARCESFAPPSLPTRVVSVGHTASNLRLCLSSGLPAKTRYLPLSHCWGAYKFITLTKQSLPSMLAHTDAQMLSKTFQDVIIITRRLGYKYIWIDSFACILIDTGRNSGETLGLDLYLLRGFVLRI